jgi:hypothetical protein
LLSHVIERITAMELNGVPAATVWEDVGAPLIVAFSVGAIAAFWPWLQALQRGRKFERTIRRELEELAPYPEHPVAGKPWWEHATKRFVHQEIFQRDRVSENRDFLLSLDPTVVYQVSQLWIALEKRDGKQWIYFVGALADNRKVGSPALRRAREKWKGVIAAQRADWLETMGMPTTFRKEAALGRTQSLFEKRFDVYARLLLLTDYGTENEPRRLDKAARAELSGQLRDWFYKCGGGLLLSGRAFDQFQRVSRELASSHATDADIRMEFSKLRTDLKIDLGVRQPGEREVPIAWPEEERW